MIYRFAEFSLDTESLELRQDGAVVRMEPQVFSVLTYLVENRDHVISKDELIEAVWDGRAISDGALNSRINSARRAVGDSGALQAFIKTFTRRGFRFICAVTGDAASEDRSVDSTFFADKLSIAVLPFGNLSDDPEQTYFSDGITEDLIIALSRVRRFRVVARSSSFSYKGRSPDIREVAHELEARYVIEGSVRSAGNRIRLTVQLIEGATGKHIWAERYDRDLEDIFVVQDELSIAIVGAVEPAMGKSEQERVKRKPPEGLDAWEAYQQGMSYFYRRTEQDMTTARTLFLRAISIDPQFALAHAGVARTYYWNVLMASSEADREEAEKAAHRAVDLDPDEAEAHLALGHVHYTNLDIDNAVAEFETAVKLNPSYASAYHLLGTALIHSGRPKAALPHLYTAIELSPKDGEIALFHARIALAYLYLREHEKAVDWAKKAVRLPGIQWPGHCFLVAPLAHLDRMDESRKALADLLAFRPGITAGFILDRYPAINSKNFNHMLDGLCKAGLPE